MPNNIDALIQSALAKMGRDAQAAFNGSYISERTKYAKDGMADLTGALASGEKSVETYIKQIAERFQSVGLEVAIDYNRASNSVVLKAYNGESFRAGEISEKDLPKFEVKLDRRGIAGKGRGAKVNKYAAYQDNNGEFGIYTLMEKQAHDMLSIIDKQIQKGRVTLDTDPRQLQSLINWGKRETMKIASAASREAQNDLVKGNRISPTHQANVSKALEVYIGGYIDALIRQHGLYAASQKEDIAGQLYTVFDAVTGARNLTEVEAVLKQLKSDPRYATLMKSRDWHVIESKLRAVRDTGFKTVAGTTNETARQRRTVGTLSARFISPGDNFMSRTVRQQGLTTVRHSRNAYQKGALATRLGESMGIKYGKEQGWDSTVNTLNVTDDLIAAAWNRFAKTPSGKKYTKTHIMPSVREGGMLISEELAKDFETATRDYRAQISQEDYERYYGQALKKTLKRLKLTEENYNSSSGAVREQVERQVQEAVYSRILAKDGRHTKGSQLTNLTKEDDGSYIFEGTEHIGYHSGQRITDTYGNTRSATQVVPRKFIEAVFHEAGFDAQSTNVSTIHAIKEQTKDVNIRNFGGRIAEDLAFVVDNGLSRGMTVPQIMKLLPSSLRNYVEKGRGKIYVDKLSEMLQDGTDDDKQALLIETLIGLDKAKAAVGGVRSYDNTGKLIGASITSNNYSVPDAYDYGHYGKAVSMSTGLPSLFRSAGVAAASGSISKNQAQQIAEHFNSRLGINPAKKEHLDQLRAQLSVAAKSTLASAQENFVVDPAKTVSIGYGDNHDIDLADETIADAKFDFDGRITNYQDTIWGRIDQLRYGKAKALAGGDLATEDDIKKQLSEVQAYIDGLDFSSYAKYDDTVYGIMGKKLFLPTYYQNQEGGDYVRKELGAVIGALKHGEVERANEKAGIAFARMQDDLYNKNGTEYRRVYREAANKSMLNKVLGANLNQILSPEDYKQASKWDRYLSDIASAGVLIAKDDGRQILKDMSDEDLDELLTTLYVGKYQGTGTYTKNHRSRNTKIDRIIAGLTVGSDVNREFVANSPNAMQGLRALLGRLPFMNGLDIASSNSLFIEDGLESGSMRFGAGLARQKNADYDGDRVAVAIESFERGLTPELKEIFDKMAIDTVEIAKKMALREKEEAQKTVGYTDKQLGKDPIYASAADVYAGIIGKTTKDDVGRLSNYSKSIRNRLALNGMDEHALLNNPDGFNQQFIAASGMITRALFESIEQDAISSKKVINRIIKAGSADNIENLTQEEQAQIYFESLTKLDQIIDDFSQGKISLHDTDEKAGLISSLQTIGVLGHDTDEETLMSGRVVEQALEMIAKFSKADAVFASLFGEGADVQSILDRGGITQQALEAALGRVSIKFGGVDGLLNTARIKKGVNDEGISAESNPAYRAGIKIDDTLITSLDKTTDAYKHLQEVLHGTSAALKEESALEKAKTAIALKEGDAIGKDAKAWRTLNGELVDAAQGYSSVSERASTILGGMGRQTGGPYGHLQGIIKEIREAVDADGNRQFDSTKYWYNPKKVGEKQEDYEQRLATEGGLSLKEISKRFQYNAVSHFTKERGVMLGSTAGTLSHAADEALGRASLAGENYSTIQELVHASNQADVSPALKQIAENYAKAEEEFREVLTILGYTQHEIAVKYNDAISRANKNYAELQEQMRKGGYSLESVEQGFGARDFNGAKIAGITDVMLSKDATYIDKNGNLQTLSNKYGQLKDRAIIDYKNQDGLLSDHDIAQQLIYRASKIKQSQELHALLDNANPQDKDKLLEAWAKQNTRNGGNWKDELAYAQDLLITRNFSNQLISTNSKGQTRAFSIGAVGQNIIDKILNNETLSEEEKAAMRGAVTYTDFDGTVKSGASGRSGKKGSSGQGLDSGVDRNERLAAYLKLLQEQYDIKLRLYKLDEQIMSAQKTQDEMAVSSLKQQKAALQELYNEQEREMNSIAYGKAVLNNEISPKARSRFNVGEKRRIADQQQKKEVALNADQKEFSADFELKTQVRVENEINSLLRERLRLEQQIATERKAVNTSFSRKEKETLLDVINLQANRVQGVDAQLEKLLGSGEYRSDKVDELFQQYQTDKGLNDAKVAASNHGIDSIFGRLKHGVMQSIVKGFNFDVGREFRRSITQTLNKVYTLTTKLESALTNLRIVTGMNREEAEDTMITYQRMGKELGATTEEVAQSALAWLRQGYSVQEAGNLIDASMKLSKLGFMQADQATQVLTASLKGFKLETSEALSVVDKLTTMDQKAAVSAQGVSEALSLMANSARLAGLSINQAIAMVSTVGEVTQQSMSTVGNAMKTMLARFGNVKAGTFSEMGEGSSEASENINDIEKVLGRLGIKIRTTSGEMREFDDVLADIAKQWNTLDSVSRNAVAGALGGVRQREAVVTLLENYERYKELTEEAEDSAGSANKKYAAYADSLEAALKRLTNAWEEFTQKLKASPIVKNGVKFITFLIEKMDKLVTIFGALAGRLLGLKLSKGLNRLVGFDGSKYTSFFDRLKGSVQKKWQSDPYVAAVHNAKVQRRFNNATSDAANELFDSNQQTFDTYAQTIERQDKNGKRYYVDPVTGKRIDQERAQELMQAKKEELGITTDAQQMSSEDYLKQYAPEKYDELQKTKQQEMYNARNPLEDERKGFFQTVKTKLDEIVTIMQRLSDKQNGKGKKDKNSPEGAVETVVEGVEEQAKIQEQITELKEEETVAAQASLQAAEQETSFSNIELMDEQQKTAFAQQGMLQERQEASYSEMGEQSERQEMVYAQMSAAAAQRQAQAMSGGGTGGGANDNQMLASMGPWGALAAEIINDVMSGVTAGIMAAQQLQTIDGKGDNEGVSVKATGGDKAIQGLTTGVLTTTISAIPLIGDTLGPILGPILGDAIGGAILRAIHKEELDRKHRVKEAQERLKVLEELKGDINKWSDTITSYIPTGEEWEEAKAAVDNFTETLWSDSRLAEEFKDTLAEVNKDLAKLSWSEITDLMLNGTAEERQQIAQTLDVATAKKIRADKEAAYEDEIYDYTATMKDGDSGKGSNDLEYITTSYQERQILEQARDDGLITNYSVAEGTASMTIGGNSAENKVKTVNEILQRLSEEGINSGYLVDKLNKVIDKYDELGATMNKINKELAEQDVNIGYIASGISSLTLVQQKAITYEGAIQMVADAMEREGIEARNGAGVIKREYLPAIESAIKADTNLSKLVRGETITYGSLVNAQEKMAVTLDKLRKLDSSITWNSLKALSQFGTRENLAQLDAYAEALGITRDQLRGLIEQSDPQRLQNFANALGVTLETLQSWGPGLETLSQSFVLELSPDKVREAKEGYQSLYDDIITTGKMSAENMEKIIADYPHLIPYLGDEVALRQEIGKILGPDGALNKAYKQSMFMMLQTSNDFFEQFKKNTNITDVMTSFFKGLTDGVQKEELKKAWENATTLEEAFAVLQSDLIEKGSATAEAVQAALEEQFNFTMKIQQDTSEWDRVMEHQMSLLDEQIDNLQAQKDALSSINEERKKELSLIKAQEALENAKKEKKMVYRAGVGFVYEANEDTIASAKDEVDSLTNEKKAESLQMEIDKLELEKQILEYLPTVEDQEQLKMLWDEWTENMRQTNGELADWTAQMADTYKKYSEIDFAEIYQEFQSAAEQRKNAQTEQLKEEADKLIEAREAVNEAEKKYGKNSVEYNQAVDKYNAQYQSYVEAQKTAKSLGASSSVIKEVSGQAADYASQGTLSNQDVNIGYMNEIQGQNKDASGKGSSGDLYMGQTLVTEGDLKDQFSKQNRNYVALYGRDDSGRTVWGAPLKDSNGNWGKIVNGIYDGKIEAGKWIYIGDYNDIAEKSGLPIIKGYQDFGKLPAYTVVGNQEKEDYFLYVDGAGSLKWLEDTEYHQGQGGNIGSRSHAAGALSVNEDFSLINELGTEGIITPEGTFTALPSHTGIVPADITKNVWQLGEVAPQLIARLGSLKNPDYVANGGGTTNNDTTNIGAVNVYPTKDYDMDKLLAEAKAKARITKHNN